MRALYPGDVAPALPKKRAKRYRIVKPALTQNDPVIAPVSGRDLPLRLRTDPQGKN
jgi:hypothetical protein